MYFIVDHSLYINFIYELTVNFEIFLLHSAVVCQLFSSCTARLLLLVWGDVTVDIFHNVSCVDGW